MVVNALDDHHLPVQQTGHMTTDIIIGGIAGILAKTAIAPAERVKMSFQVSSDKFSLRDALKRGNIIFEQYGVLGLWKGHSTTVLRVAPFAGLSYAFHDKSEEYFKSRTNSQTLSMEYKFLAGAIGGFCGTVLTYPLDVMRVRLALIPNSTWTSTLSQGGLFQGLKPTLLGIIPYSGTGWCVKQVLHENFEKIYLCHPTVLEALLMNAVAGIASQFVTYPLDILRRRIQMFEPTTNQLKPPTIRAAFTELVTKEGLSGLTKGFSLNIIKGPITLSISLTSYDVLKKWFADSSSCPPPALSSST